MNYKQLNAIRYSNRKIPLEMRYDVTVKRYSCTTDTLTCTTGTLTEQTYNCKRMK